MIYSNVTLTFEPVKEQSERCKIVLNQSNIPKDPEQTEKEQLKNLKNFWLE